MKLRSTLSRAAVGHIVALAAIATLGVCPQSEAGDAGSDLTSLTVSFKLDPRLTRSLYMGDRWVSPAVYTRVGDADKVDVEAKATGIDRRGQPVAVEAEWLAADPELVAVKPGPAGEATLVVQREGRTTVEVKARGVSRTLSVTATRKNNAIQVDITEDR
jgi:hypothetical protein